MPLARLKPFIPYLKRPDEAFRMALRWTRRSRSDLPFVFILGPGRSGSTLLHRVLLNHSLLRGFDVQTFIFSARPIHDHARFAHFVPRESWSAAMARGRTIADFFAALHEAALPLPPGGRHVEKTPQHVRHLSYLMDRFPRAQFILTIRDPRDTYCSGRKDAFIPQASDIARHCRYFHASTEPYFRLSAPQRERVRIVRYEDFTAAPLDQLRSLLAFLDLPDEAEQQIDPAATGAGWRSADAQFRRLAEPITPATVGRWRAEMSAAEQAEYRRLGGDQLVRLGYPLE